MLEDQKEKNSVKEIIELALREFSEGQVNLASSSAREAIAMRISTDIISKYTLTKPMIRTLPIFKKNIINSHLNQ